MEMNINMSIIHEKNTLHTRISASQAILCLHFTLWRLISISSVLFVILFGFQIKTQLMPIRYRNKQNHIFPSPASLLPLCLSSPCDRCCRLLLRLSKAKRTLEKERSLKLSWARGKKELRCHGETTSGAKSLVVRGKIQCYWGGGRVGGIRWQRGKHGRDTGFYWLIRLLH